ncbi:hypothetical protein QSV08_07690 [Maribacter sp. BPC-D8]|uniref:hypothetical protein n=1 Tax=Maribacter sp. BPC-D8 TaxID=3053613 RepID=UPI002B4A7015|nr:hypothetical protein [Maribacter sp. BPC-D8]WRI31126.1 hypothetical protein QSV08_07690 [Maribacter sp. BPC-D8]
MKLNKSNLFLLIWITHLFAYYSTFSFILKIANNDYKEFYNVFWGFAIGLYGLYEQIPCFFLFPLLLMLILINIKSKLKWFTAYILATFFTYSIDYFWIFLNHKQDIVLYSPDSINLILLIMSSLLVSIIFNWLIFRKTYIKLDL